MSQLSELQRDIQDASAAVAHAERTLASHPNVPSVVATLRAIEKRRKNLEEQFTTVAHEMGFDVCSYRIELPEYRRPTIAGMTAVLGAFQNIFTNVYNVIINGVRKTSRVSADIIEVTSFGFAYTFPGSLGVMMTLENDRLLLDETHLDLAMRKTFDLMSCTSAAEIQEAAKEVGLPAVRQAYQWASENAKAGYGVNVMWQREGVTKFGIRVQAQEIVRLESAIKIATSKEQAVVVGDLLDVSISDKTFRMEVDDRMIQGRFDEAISRAHPAQLPRRYRATLIVREKAVAEDGEEAITYFLSSLDPDDPREAPPLSALPSL